MRFYLLCRVKSVNKSPNKIINKNSNSIILASFSHIRRGCVINTQNKLISILWKWWIFFWTPIKFCMPNQHLSNCLHSQYDFNEMYVTYNYLLTTHSIINRVLSTLNQNDKKKLNVETAMYFCIHIEIWNWTIILSIKWNWTEFNMNILKPIVYLIIVQTREKRSTKVFTAAE